MLIKSSGARGGSEPPSYGRFDRDYIPWRCLTTLLHNRGFRADGKALRLEDVHFVEVKTCFERSTPPTQVLS